MTAVTSIASSAERPVRDPVETFVPWADPESKEIRRALVRARDMATSRVIYAASAEARTLLWLVIETATRWMFAPASIAELLLARIQCARLAQCASFAETEGAGQ